MNDVTPVTDRFGALAPVQLPRDLTLRQLQSSSGGHHRGGSGGKQRKFICEYCPYTSDYRAKLNRHMRLHTGERPYQCEVCGRAFTRKDHLQKHLPTHDGRVLKDSLSSDHHHHNNNGNGTLASAASFLGSLLSATSQHPYRCKLCGRGFIQKHHYERHAKTHDDHFVDY
ncbi:hypothetical protein HPB52_014576 [Rhipicephalus sanguineus]|uniref:C2H2-type domain-containing protein n=1 Tax=Rhipicephalus sanguineus TaxID=34632 RepID=A0A9D4T3R2_RHISA|nr:hypothetical protein HPB52_014576 [Rhipicephalus sanguineus]